MVDDENIKTTVSPFAIRDGEIKTFDGKDWYVSINQIINKINLGHINEIHFKILDLINEFEFMTSRQIYQLLVQKGADVKSQDKLNNKLEKVEITEKYNDLFFRTVENVGCSFVRSTDDVLLNIFESITADPDVSEKTDKYKDYNFIYISNDICRELIIRNKWFFEEETTEKPENINSFLNTAPIRTETAPHR